ncbi:MAG: hypothetical protein N2512_10590 [Armatimonadetes bacterium]|nr:hypothetical protein [Armatimonadota bacterium]
MSQDNLRPILRQWFNKILDATPPEDTRRSDECLTFAELIDLAEEGVRKNREPLEMLPENAAQHVRACSWCKSALANAWRIVQGEGVNASNDAEQWATALRERLADWVGRRVRESPAPAAARFDEKGTFHLHLYGLPRDGPVQVSLLWEGVRLYLARGNVTGGCLRLREQLARIGLRDTTVPAHLLVIEPLEEE